MLNALVASLVLSTVPCKPPVVITHPIKVWKELGGTLKLESKHKEDVVVGAQYGRFDTLKLQELNGRTTVKQVTIVFADGCAQNVVLNQTLDANSPTLTIDLDGKHREIQRVVVTGSSSWNGTYELFAV
jgi:hypothetical protein